MRVMSERRILPGRVEVDDFDAGEQLLTEAGHGRHQRVEHVQVAFYPRATLLERAPRSPVTITDCPFQSSSSAFL